MLEALDATAGVFHFNVEFQPAGLLAQGGNGDAVGAAVLDQRGQRLLGVLAGQYGHAADILLALQLVQAGTQSRVGPVATQRRHQPQVDRVGQVVLCGNRRSHRFAG